MKLDHDLHVHTYLSACCSDREHQRPAEILVLAEEMGVKTIGFADHVWQNPNLAPSNWYRPQDASQIDKIRSDLSAISTNIRVFVGCEADTIAPGKFSITPDFAQQLDFVLLACSHFHMKDFVEQPVSIAPRDIAKHMLKFFISGVSSGFATSIPHPMIPCGYMQYFDKAVKTISDVELLDVFALAESNGVGIEVTTAFIPSAVAPEFSIETSIRMLSLAKQAGCMFTLGSDAHEPSAQKRLPELNSLIEPAGICEDDILPLLR